jgi:hypothetical protein
LFKSSYRRCQGGHPGNAALAASASDASALEASSFDACAYVLDASAIDVSTFDARTFDACALDADNRDATATINVYRSASLRRDALPTGAHKAKIEVESMNT